MGQSCVANRPLAMAYDGWSQRSRGLPAALKENKHLGLFSLVFVFLLPET